MSSHWSAIGIYSQEEFREVLAEAFKAPTKVENSSGGATHLLTDGTMEVWVHVDGQCAMPSAATTTQISALANEWLEADDGCPYCATLGVEVLLTRHEFNFPLALAFGNAVAARNKIELGSSIELNLSAFIETGQVWEDVETYWQANPNEIMGPNWFIPLGPYAAVESMRDNNARMAIFGVVREIAVQTNPWTNNTFRTVKIECADVVYDAVIEDNVLPELVVNNVIFAECWLCASLASAPLNG